MGRQLIPSAKIIGSIHLLRGQKVMLDFDLAALYRVTTKALNQAVKRNAPRFPSDFMFRVTAEEARYLILQPGKSNATSAPAASRSQTVTLKRGGNIKYTPHAFTEQGVAMLSSVLRSERAVKVNIAIMRAFVQLRGALETNREWGRKFAELEGRVGKHDEEISAIVDAIRRLMAPQEKTKREIGFHVREASPRYGTRKGR